MIGIVSPAFAAGTDAKTDDTTVDVLRQQENANAAYMDAKPVGAKSVDVIRTTSSRRPDRRRKRYKANTMSPLGDRGAGDSGIQLGAQRSFRQRQGLLRLQMHRTEQPRAIAIGCHAYTTEECTRRVIA